MTKSEYSSNAEKAWEEFVDSLELDFTVGWAKRRTHLHVGFKAGYAFRDAEVATLIEVIEASSRTYEELEAEQATRDAEVGVLREQLAAAEARAGKVWDYVTKPLTWQESLSRDFAGKPMARFVDRDEIAALMLNLSPTMALAAHDREVAARTLEDAAQVVDDMTFAADYLRDSIARWLRERANVERAAAIRKGDTNA